jgi:hypothetical protein
VSKVRKALVQSLFTLGEIVFNCIHYCLAIRVKPLFLCTNKSSSIFTDLLKTPSHSDHFPLLIDFVFDSSRDFYIDRVHHVDKPRVVLVMLNKVLVADMNRLAWAIELSFGSAFRILTHIVTRFHFINTLASPAF